ncbi:MAG TPA: ABC transporter ATP-binding protein [Longimicrobium sp.]|nr:ABC transporter ATP-binding protein [Longimicrobium sp.]
MDLVIQHLWKTYPNGTTALRDVSLTIPPGLFGLLGPNGAGKSTLMRILATLQEAEAGTARLGEIDVLRQHDAVRRTLGYLPQEFGLYPRVAAEDMLDHFGLLKGLTDRAERRDIVHALLQQTNLWHARRQKLGSFSGGMRQRFGIAVALIGRPRLIVVDEPTAGLDPAERARFLNLLSELGENAVVILSTHIVEDVSELCTRMAIIAAGRILLEAEPVRAVEAMRGRVWRRQVDRAELPRYEQALPVISTTLVGGRTVIHVFADAPPDPTFEPVEPDLKDVYFTVIKGISIAPHPSASAEVEGAHGAPFVTRTMDGDAGPADGSPVVAPSPAAEPTGAPAGAAAAGDGRPEPAAASLLEPRAEVVPPPPPASAAASAGAAPPPHPPARREPGRAGPGAAHMPVFGEPGERRAPDERTPGPTEAA